jgi:hypothetical protein
VGYTSNLLVVTPLDADIPTPAEGFRGHDLRSSHIRQVRQKNVEDDSQLIRSLVAGDLPRDASADDIVFFEDSPQRS